MNKQEIKGFNELSLKQLYEISGSRCEVFIQEQKIICEEELDGPEDRCTHVFLEENERVIAYCRIVPKGISCDTTYKNV